MNRRHLTFDGRDLGEVGCALAGHQQTNVLARRWHVDGRGYVTEATGEEQGGGGGGDAERSSGSGQGDAFVEERVRMGRTFATERPLLTE